MKYGIALFPSKQIQDIANSYRKRYDPHYALIPPHVTLKEAFEAEEDHIEEVVQELSKVAKETQPFSLMINKLSTFSPVTNTIYMKVEPADGLMELHQKLHQSDIPNGQTFSFVPHITIAQKLSDDEHSDVYGSLRMISHEFEETIDRFQLLYQLENGSWTVYETFRLGKG
ncbi:2'-5' RNA ligase family protein [Pontibacillus sp. ALD_SL1]|uniref:YjcG family protein n=1 Tax=Pontibacillus sp. ALD_SL1 TaxID=2777185 RepID=UPI001A95B2A0|nr:YjcG family protein [Pontibacillus sp. ALD_SL1]QST00853.1 2'-5' RNA ligase family protein [Pontibacillus sp. ALD_SL1]